MSAVTVVKYQCTKCGEKDSYKCFSGEIPLPCFNCWNCGAGKEYPNIHEQQMRQVGMLPIPEPGPEIIN